MNGRRRGPMLVIGYGSSLLGDDAAGRAVAEAVAAWGLPGLSVRSEHQLLPELAEALAGSRRAVFVDARPAAAGDDARLERIGPDGGRRPPDPHASSPQALLELARLAFGRVPQAWLLTVPAVDFALGADLSPTASRGVAQALALLGEMVRVPGKSPRRS